MSSNDSMLADLGMKYFFTSYGAVYAGFEDFITGDFDNLVIVQSNHIKDCMTLPQEHRTVDKFREKGWVIPKGVVVRSVPYGNIIRDQRHDVGVLSSPEIDRKDMFLFGAGASANCVTADFVEEFKKDLLRPPLGNGLFGKHFREIYKNYEGVRKSITELAERDINIEEFFETEWQQVEEGDLATMNRHINIQYYLQEVLTKVSHNVCEEYFDSSLYAKLALKLRKLHQSNNKRHFAMVSFNQDTILEHFFEREFNRKIKSMPDYVRISEWPFSIFKPHGSVNWGWKFPANIGTASQQNLYNANLSFHKLYFELLGSPENMIDPYSYYMEAATHDHNIGKYTIDKSRIQIIPANASGHYYPALLLPYRDKDEFTFPSMHFNGLNACLPSIENLYIIGWKGNERAFNKILSEKATNIKKIVIADPCPKVVEQNLSRFLSGKSIEIVHYDGFEDFVDRGL